MEINGQIVILILFVVISAIKWAIEKFKGEHGTPPETSETLEDIYDNFREDILQRQTTVQQPTYSPPPIPQSPPPVQPTQVALPQPRPKKVQPTSLSAEEQAAAVRFQQLSSGQRKKRKSPQASIHSLLSTPQSARQAIILQEILGKPKSMQDA